MQREPSSKEAQRWGGGWGQQPRQGGRCRGGRKASTGGPRTRTRPSPGARGQEGPGFETRSRAQGPRLGRAAEGRGGQQQTKARRDAPQPRLPLRPPPPRRRPERAEPGPRAPPLRSGSARPEDRQNASGSEVKGERSKVEGGGRALQPSPSWISIKPAGDPRPRPRPSPPPDSPNATPGAAYVIHPRRAGSGTGAVT